MKTRKFTGVILMLLLREITGHSIPVKVYTKEKSTNSSKFYIVSVISFDFIGKREISKRTFKFGGKTVIEITNQIQNTECDDPLEEGVEFIQNTECDDPLEEGVKFIQNTECDDPLEKGVKFIQNTECDGTIIVPSILLNQLILQDAPLRLIVYGEEENVNGKILVSDLFYIKDNELHDFEHVTLKHIGCFIKTAMAFEELCNINDKEFIESHFENKYSAVETMPDEIKKKRTAHFFKCLNYLSSNSFFSKYQIGKDKWKSFIKRRDVFDFTSSEWNNHLTVLSGTFWLSDSYYKPSREQKLILSIFTERLLDPSLVAKLATEHQLCLEHEPESDYTEKTSFTTADFDEQIYPHFPYPSES